MRLKSIQRFSELGSVDVANGIITGVSVITEGEVLGHDQFADQETLLSVMKCAITYAGGLKVKADHWSGIFATIGFLKDFRIDGSSLRADLHLLSSESNRAKILEMAQRMPETFGISITFSGKPEKKSGKNFTRCTEIYSADVVDTPAANPNGLFSAVDNTSEDMSAENFEALSGQLTAFETKFTTALGELKTELAAIKTANATEATALTARLDKLEAAKTELSKVIADTSKESLTQLMAKLGTSGAPAAGAQAAPGTGAKTFGTLVAEQLAKDPKAGKAAAVSFCVGAFPVEHAEFQKTGGPL